MCCVHTNEEEELEGFFRSSRCTVCEVVAHRAVVGHTGDTHTVDVPPPTLKHLECMLPQLSCMPRSTPVTSQTLCTQARREGIPDKHMSLFSCLHTEKICYRFSFHILGFQGWMRKEAVRKPDLFLPHPEPSSRDG